jgi:hypothetical protein
MMRSQIVLLALILWRSFPAGALSIPIGVLSFDGFIPAADGSPGVNAFNISNFTGGADLLPDFSVTTALTLLNASLTANPSSGPPQVIPLGDIGTGALLEDGTPSLVLQFPGNRAFASASFTATLSPTSFELGDGNVFVAEPTIFVTLLPSMGSLLVANSDAAEITAQPAVAVPEPGTWILSAIGFLTGFLTRAHRSGCESPRAFFGCR